MTEGNNNNNGPLIGQNTQSILRGNGNQSVVSIANNGNVQNQKSRIVRTITNKNLGKNFNFMDKSPVSVGGANQSILSHYYGQKHNLNYKTSGTPMRTNGMNSPVFYNFQSPVRRQNTFGNNTNANNNNKL